MNSINLSDINNKQLSTQTNNSNFKRNSWNMSKINSVDDFQDYSINLQPQSTDIDIELVSKNYDQRDHKNKN